MGNNNNIPTPHIAAKAGDFAETVLLPGDPLRAKFIAENFLENAKLVTGVRNVLGFTGEWKGRRVSVMGTGMGMPSIGIYSYELMNFYGCENLIRIVHDDGRESLWQAEYEDGKTKAAEIMREWYEALKS